MAYWVETPSLRINLLRIGAVGGFLLTLLWAGFVFIYAGLVEESYEADVRSEPWEWAVVASLLGAIAVAVAVYGFVTCSRRAVRVGALAQGVAALTVLAVALPNFDFWRSEFERDARFERNFIAVAVMVLLFDTGVLVASWALPRSRT